MPRFVRLCDHRKEGEGPFLARDDVDGITLDAWARQPLEERTVSRAVDLICRVCDILSCLHTPPTPLVHMEIEPGHVVLDRSGHVWVSDPGISRGLGSDGATRPNASPTPGYAPVEQYEDSAVGPAADVYALGATLYTLLTGVVPPPSVALRAGEATLGPSCDNNPGIPTALEMMLHRMMALDAADRYASVRDVRAALQVFVPQGEEKTQSTALPTTGDAAPVAGLAAHVVSPPSRHKTRPTCSFSQVEQVFEARVTFLCCVCMGFLLPTIGFAACLLPDSATRGLGGTWPAVLSYLLQAFAWVTLAQACVCVHRIAAVIDAPANPWWSMAIFFLLPCPFFVIVTIRTDEWLQWHGVDVGWLGPRRSSLERLRREQHASPALPGEPKAGAVVERRIAWAVLAVGAACMAWPWLPVSKEWTLLEAGPGEHVYYGHGVTEREARALLKVLQDVHSFEDSAIAVRVAKSVHWVVVSFATPHGDWNLPGAVAGFSRLGYRLSVDAFENSDVEIRMCDAEFTPHKIIQPHPYGTWLRTSAPERLYFTEEIEVIEACAVEKILREAGFFDGRAPRDVHVTRVESVYTLRLVVVHGFEPKFEADQGLLKLASTLGPAVSKRVFGGRPVEVLLCDSSFVTRQVIPSVPYGQVR